VNNEINTQLGCISVAKVNHFAKFITRIDMQQREWNLPGIEGLLSKTKQDGRILSYGIKENRSLALRHNFAENMNALGLKLPEMSLRAQHEKRTTNLYKVDGGWGVAVFLGEIWSRTSYCLCSPMAFSGHLERSGSE
jgi:hypothetical protein